MSAYFITAIGTPLDSEESLHEEGLEAHLADQWSAGIQGILVGGTMGLMQMLRDQTYRRLVQRSIELSRGKGEVLVGAGDTSLARTRERIEFLNRLPIDGIVVITPFFLPFTQGQLLDYFRTLADAARRPLYLYDLPAVTHVSIDLGTYSKLAEHPNIRGVKISGRAPVARQLIDQMGESFRVIVAEPDLIDALLRHGVNEHLDGMYAVAPHWAVELGRAADAGDWDSAAAYQRRLTELRNLLVDDPGGGMGYFTAMMNARGIPGAFYAAPFPPPTDQERQAVLASRAMRELLSSPNLRRRTSAGAV